MKSGILIAAAAAAGLMLATSMASAHETRMGDAALGATAGMLVAGPIGLVAGGAIGYTQGPHISHHIFHGHHHYRHYRRYHDHDYR
ncbi:MAG: hypothetical protein ACTHLO_12740 [Pseudolabrys sp.]